MSPIDSRPFPFSSASGGEVSPSAGSHDFSHAWRGGVESQLNGTADIGQAHQFFNPATASNAIGNAAIAAPVGNAAMAAPMLHGAEAALMPLVPGASEPISPLIQLIMRMPGHIGLLNSFFEALGAFFLPQLHAIGLDFSLFDIHAQVSHLADMATHLTGAEHFHIDPSILPHDAPIFQHGLGLTAGQHGTALITHSEMLNPRDALKVSGGPDINAPQFEHSAAGQSLSGPSISDSPMGNHLAGGQRLFSDRFQGTLFSKSGMHGSILANGASSGATTATNSALNVSGNTFAAQPQSLPAVAQPTDGLTGGTAPAGGSLFDGNSISKALNGGNGDSQLLASNPATDSFRPSLGGGQNVDASASYLQSPGGDTAAVHSAPAAHGSLLKPLHAKELSLDSVTKPAAPAAHKLVHSGPPPKAPCQTNSQTATAKTVSSSPTAKAETNAVESGTKIADASPAKAHAHHGSSADKPVADKSVAKEVAKPTAKTASKIDAPKPASKPADNQITDTKFVSDLKPNGTYTIRSGDCLWNIAKNHMGSAAKWADIYKLNQDVLGSNPDMIHTGVTLKMPGMNGVGNGNTDMASAGAEATKYVVKPGDNLWNIAKDQLHDATKWGDLYKANTDVIGSNARLITPGEQLVMPGSDHALVANAGGINSGSSSLGQMSEGFKASSGTMSTTAPAAEFGAPGGHATMDGAMPVSPSHPVDMQTLSQPSMQAPAMQPPAMPTHSLPQHVAPAPAAQPSTLQRMIPTLQTGPGAAIPAPVHVGPGAASASTLHTTSFDASNALQGAETLRPVVKSTMGSDIATFLSQTK
jgi:nucleoid-associated protein YgaU